MQKKQIPLSEKQRIIKEMASRIKKRKNIIFAYIFGSFVRDDEFSDIDIGIFCKKLENIDPLSFEFELEKDINSITKFPVDVRIINHAPVSFVFAVIKEGLLVKDEDPNKRADFEGMIFKKYADFAIYRKRYLREVLNAPI